MGDFYFKFILLTHYFMKNRLLKSSFIFSLLIIISSCTERDNVIDDVLDGVTNGAVLRTINIVSSDVPLGDDTANFTIEIEEQDNQDGALLDEVRVFVSFTDNTDDGVDVGGNEVLFNTISASEFTPGPFGLPRTTISILAVDMLSALSLQSSDTNGGDQFAIRLELQLTDGRVFTNSNTGGVVQGGFFRSPFLYFANITCPFTTSLAETFDYVSYDMGPGDGSGGQQATGFGPINGTITWTDSGEEGLYGTPDFSFGMFGFVWGDSPATNGSAQIKWFCSSLLPEGADQYSDSYTYTITNVSGPTMTIMWSNTWGDIGTVDLTREGNADWPVIFQ